MRAPVTDWLVAGLVASSLTMSLILRPSTPPWAFWYAMRASADGTMPVYSGAAVPVTGVMSPRVMVLEVTPGALAPAGPAASTTGADMTAPSAAAAANVILLRTMAPSPPVRAARRLPGSPATGGWPPAGGVYTVLGPRLQHSISFRNP